MIPVTFAQSLEHPSSFADTEALARAVEASDSPELAARAHLARLRLRVRRRTNKNIVVYAMGFFIGLAILGILITFKQERFGSVIFNSLFIIYFIFLITRIAQQK